MRQRAIRNCEAIAGQGEFVSTREPLRRQRHSQSIAASRVSNTARSSDRISRKRVLNCTAPGAQTIASRTRKRRSPRFRWFASA